MIRALQFVGLLMAVPLVGVVILVWGWNPWFMDDTTSFGLMVLGPLVVLGGLVGPRLRRIPGGWRGTLTALIAGGLTLVRPMPAAPGTELLIVGIDGATWDVADELDLPALEDLRAHGKSGVLIGEEPLFSPLLWTTMATGKRPEAHGIHGFRVRQDQATAARFWEIARAGGKRVGLYKWLVTWPPPAPEVPGFVVPAWLAPDASTHPSTISWVKELELSRRVHRKRVAAVRPLWRLGLAGLAQGVRWSTVWAVIRMQVRAVLSTVPERKKIAFNRHLRVLIDRDLFVAQLHIHRPHLATFTMYATDALGHTHWGLQGNATIHGAYRLADKVLAELVDRVGPSAHVLVLSDHGFRGATPEDRARRRLPTTQVLEALIQEQVGSVEIARVGHKLTLTWLGDDPADGRAQLNRWLQDFVVRSTELPLFRVERIHGRERVLGLTLADGAFASSDIETETVMGHPLSDLVRLAPGQAGEHDARGIVVLSGPGISQADLGEVSQLDVTPTVLAVLGLAAAKDMPGRAWVAEPLARVGSHDALAPAQADDAVKVQADVNEEALKALGYVE
jgi:hypothetical protein